MSKFTKDEKEFISGLLFEASCIDCVYEDHCTIIDIFFKEIDYKCVELAEKIREM